MAESGSLLRPEIAVANNACWCDAVCRAHGIPGEFHPAVWLNRRPVPPFYSNAVTLLPGEEAQQRADIQELIDSGSLGTFSVKDSFAALDLAPLGFHILFAATWIGVDAAKLKLLPSPPGARWARIQSEGELARWEQAWSGPVGDPAWSRRIFPAALLDDPEIVFIAAFQEERIVAGAIANRSGEVVGVSNVFTPPEAALPYWSGCVRAILEAFPGLPLVGYERGEELAVAQSLGFAALGGLRVWERKR